jgi:hypothetical protein
MDWMEWMEQMEVVALVEPRASDSIDATRGNNGKDGTDGSDGIYDSDHARLPLRACTLIECASTPRSVVSRELLYRSSAHHHYRLWIPISAL